MEIVAGPSLLVGLPLALAAGLAIDRRFGRQERETLAEKLCYLAASVAMTIGYFAWHPGILVDDAGFIVRYLLQSDEGCLYCFNASDGPIFGISSFSHGALTLFLYRIGFGSPESCLRLSSIAGFLGAAWLLLEILRRLISRRVLVIPLAFTTLFGAKSWMMVGATGMETPLHSAIVLAAVLSLVSGRERQLWWWLAMAVISKLDAVPIALAVGTLHLWRRRVDWSRVQNNPFVEAARWAGIPLILWIAFSYWYFGSPLPHSATAKLQLHQSSLDHWFPFLERYLSGKWLRCVFALFVVLWPLHLVAGRRRGLNPGETVSGWSFAGLLVLYYCLNPAERMEWYYALPDLLLVLQVTLSLQFLGDRLLRGQLAAATPVALVLLGALCLFDAAHGVRFFTTYLRSLEGERYAIGKYIAGNTGRGEVLLAGHGLPAAWSSSTVVDFSGLNSRQTLRHGGKWESLVRSIQPDSIIVSGYEYYLDPLKGLPYRIAETFYEIADQGAPPWRLLRRVRPAEPFTISFLGRNDFSGIDARLQGGQSFDALGVNLAWLSSSRDPAPRFLRMGVLRPVSKATRLVVRTYWEDDLMEQKEFTMSVAEERRERSIHWHGVVIPLDPRFSGRKGYRVALSLNGGGPVRIYAPVLTQN